MSSTPAVGSGSRPSGSRGSSGGPADEDEAAADDDGDDGDDVETWYVIRHGDRYDCLDPTWKPSQPPESRSDTHLSPLGFKQAEDVARALVSSNRHIRHILSSPYLRAIQTSVPLSKALNIPIKLENSIWETGSRRPPRPHFNEGFPLDESGYESGFTPKVRERSHQFRERLARTAKWLLKRWPHGSGDIALFTHADPVAYLVTELCGIDPARTGPVAPCCIFKLQRSKATLVPGRPHLFTLVENASIDHLNALGPTEPCHPIHKFHDWCRLFQEMRSSGLVSASFRWPPQPEEMPALKKAWKERYARLLRDGPSEGLGTGENQASAKVKYCCEHCGVKSYISADLYKCGPPSHTINCWNCKGKSKLPRIQEMIEQYKARKTKAKLEASTASQPADQTPTKPQSASPEST